MQRTAASLLSGWDATQLHLLFCVWAPFQRRSGCREGCFTSRSYPKSSWQTGRHSPWRPGGTHHPTMQAQLSSELSAWCWTLCLAFYPDQQFTDTVTWFLPLLHCPGAWMLPWFSGTHNPSLQTDSFFYFGVLCLGKTVRSPRSLSLLASQPPLQVQCCGHKP